MYVSVRDWMVGTDDFASPLEGLRHLGVEAVEIALAEDFSVLAMDSKEKIRLGTDGEAVAYRRHLEGLGLKPVAFLTARDFSGGDLEASIAWVARALELAEILGMPAIRIDSAMKRERELDFDTRVRLFAQGLGGALDRTQGLKVTMGIENHGYQGNNLAFLLNVFMAVGSDRLGSTLDTGNFYWRGYPLSEIYGILRVLAPYAKHTHVKNIQYPVEHRESIRECGWEYGTYAAPIPDGDIDHAKVARILLDAGYTGDFCLEDESVECLKSRAERLSVLERDVAHLKEIVAGLG